MVISDQVITQHIQKYLAIDPKAKDSFGEVMTPPLLIDEILDHLPKSVWTNPALKWLDPCAGTGNFAILVYLRLMRGLTKSIPDAGDRHNHIISEMLFMVELNPKNAAILHGIFGKDSKGSKGSKYMKGSANIFEQDYLKFFDKKNTNTFDTFDTFDIIVGNPPYQTPKKGVYKGSQGASKSLWPQFVELSLAHLAPGGYLGFVTPANWRRPEHPLFTTMTRENRLRFLHIYGKDRGMKIFGVQTRFDTYIVEKSDVKSLKPRSLILIDEKGKTHTNINVLAWPFIPNYMFSQIQRLIIKRNNNDITRDKSKDNPELDIIYSASIYDTRKMSLTKSKKYPCPTIHTMTKKGLGLRYTKDRGCLTKKRKPPNRIDGVYESFFGIPKVILNFNEKLYPYNDYKGEYGLSQLSFGIRIDSKEQGDQIISGLNSPVFKDIVAATKWGSFQTDWRMFRYFRRDFFKLLV